MAHPGRLAFVSPRANEPGKQDVKAPASLPRLTKPDRESAHDTLVTQRGVRFELPTSINYWPNVNACKLEMHRAGATAVLAGLPLSAADMDLLFQALLRPFAPDGQPAMDTLDVSGTPLTDENIPKFAKVLEVHPNLTRLHIAATRVGDTGAACLGSALRVQRACSPVLPVPNFFVLTHNINVSSFICIFCSSHWVQLNTALQSLALVGSPSLAQLGDEGAVALGEALRFNTCLGRLVLAHHRIGDVGAAALYVVISIYLLTSPLWFHISF
jgi:hypothetical protein